jgi:putative acyl-CoA dehydrogenase
MPVELIEKTSVTHEVFNQVPQLTAYNAFDEDTVLAEAVEREGAGWASGPIRALGMEVGSERIQELARLANKFTPELKTHDRFGNRIDLVEFHPAYHELMGVAFGAAVHSFAWINKRPGAHVARAALSYLWNQAENGVACPTGMAYSAIPVLMKTPEVGDIWVPAINSTKYDPRPVPISEKSGATIGMTLTEKQGGSDLRANTTRARAMGRSGPGAAYEITGHKWFCSAPMSDAFYTLAYTEKGPTCFLVPRSLPDGRRNPFHIQRLKDKCGNRSNASSEIEFNGTFAWALSEEGRGVRAAIEMAHLTRLDFAIGSAGLMRQALTQAIHHTTHRRAFQRALVDQPAMRNVIADLAIESEANTALAFRLARASDETLRGDEAARLLERIVTPVAKYWNCKRAPAFVHEALECHGGNGFIEEHIMPRLYREAPLNGIWEGSGNVIALDVLRAIQREPDAVPVLFEEIRKAHGADRRLDAFVDRLQDDLQTYKDAEANARRIAEMIALAMQGSLLVRHSIPAVADAFCASRLDGQGGRAFGTLPPGLDLSAIIDRARVGTAA